MKPWSPKRGSLLVQPRPQPTERRASEPGRAAACGTQSRTRDPIPRRPAHGQVIGRAERRAAKPTHRPSPRPRILSATAERKTSESHGTAPIRLVGSYRGLEASFLPLPPPKPPPTVFGFPCAFVPLLVALFRRLNWPLQVSALLTLYLASVATAVRRGSRAEAVAGE